MKTLWNYSNYGNDLRLTSSDANSVNQSGDADDTVKAISLKPYVAIQLINLDAKQLAKELKDYGTWDENELKDHDQNLQRWIWISACDIDERKNS